MMPAPADMVVELIFPEALRLLRVAELCPAENANVFVTDQRDEVCGVTVIEPYG
jgi:hypothetical protein